MLPFFIVHQNKYFPNPVCVSVCVFSVFYGKDHVWCWASLLAQMVKNPEMQETQVRSLGWEDPLEKGMATHSSSRVWRLPGTEEPGGFKVHGVTKNLTRLSTTNTCVCCYKCISIIRFWDDGIGERKDQIAFSKSVFLCLLLDLVSILKATFCSIKRNSQGACVKHLAEPQPTTTFSLTFSLPC